MDKEPTNSTPEIEQIQEKNLNFQEQIDLLKELSKSLPENKRELFDKALNVLLTKIETLEEEKDTDDLTGLLRRNAFIKKFQESIEEIRIQKKIFQERENKREGDENININENNTFYLFLDIDNFGQINKNYGENFGDMLLKDVADILKKMTRHSMTKISDLVARWGGEEMVITLFNIDKNNTIEKAEEIRAAIEAITQKYLDKPNLNISASIGMSQHIENSTIDDTINKADIAMRVAKKERGKNNVVFYNELTENQIIEIQKIIKEEK